MRHPALVVLLCLACSAASAVLTCSLRDEPPSANLGSDHELSQVFLGLETRLDRLIAALSGRSPDAPPPPRLSPPRPGGLQEVDSLPRDVRASLAESAPLSGGLLPRSSESPALPPMKSKVLDQLIDENRTKNAWLNDEALRRRWMFLGEAAALAHFGAPTSIEVHGGTASWIYRLSEDGRRRVQLNFFRGRLVGIHMTKGR